MIWAGIVVYNPKLERLIANIDSISKQTQGVAIFVNECDKECESYLNNLNNDMIHILWSSENKGIAYALNAIMKEAKENGAEWVITLDQDSICPLTLVSMYKEKIDDDKLAIVCPRIVDKRRVYMRNQQYNECDEYVERCITSASCTRISAWESVGKFDDDLFIDLVDNDFCKRLRIAGWKILKRNSIVLDQEYGDITPKSEKVVAFYYNISKKIKNPYLAKNIAKLSYHKRVNPMRVYYTNRNVVYLNKKFKRYGGIGYDTYCCKSYLGFMITFNLASIARGKGKIKIVKSIYKGIIDGRKMNVSSL